MTAVGLPVAWLLLRSLHQLSRRWIVFVPAGLVVVDPIGLTDSMLIRRRQLRALGPAPAGSTAFDLTQHAPGLALQAVLSEEVDVAVARPGRGRGDATKATAVLFTPTLPGAVLEEARARRLAS
jgi:hypothetical protein